MCKNQNLISGNYLTFFFFFPWYEVILWLALYFLMNCNHNKIPIIKPSFHLWLHCTTVLNRSLKCLQKYYCRNIFLKYCQLKKRNEEININIKTAPHFLKLLLSRSRFQFLAERHFHWETRCDREEESECCSLVKNR